MQLSNARVKAMCADLHEISRTQNIPIEMAQKADAWKEYLMKRLSENS